MSETLPERVEEQRKKCGLSQRQLSAESGVAFSTLSRVARGAGAFSEESARKLRKWLGDDVSGLASKAEIERAEELGRAMARACAAEIIRIVRSA